MVSFLPVRFAASKLIEGDQRILEQLELDENEQELLEHIAVQMEAERGLDRAAAIADMRSNLAPIPEKAVKAQFADLIARSNGAIESIKVTKALGAASVGQTFLCTIKMKGETKTVTV